VYVLEAIARVEGWVLTLVIMYSSTRISEYIESLARRVLVEACTIK
jgi:hypothetical protein